MIILSTRKYVHIFLFGIRTKSRGTNSLLALLGVLGILLGVLRILLEVLRILLGVLRILLRVL